ncbi:hypothetical protein L1987_20633 [Smallanthus sonchifolius]|uniref:Uncharacterized protein n=1 Tax=Smallanthus sonchifolius TaxID=185202 RepID=A0ACB9ITX3_9ASTR|nr:hypothetical protein L1987_20633 [Smallanthus sonchifolius]
MSTFVRPTVTKPIFVSPTVKPIVVKPVVDKQEFRKPIGIRFEASKPGFVQPGVRMNGGFQPSAVNPKEGFKDNSCVEKTRNASTKFSEKANEGIFLGYVANSLNKRVYNKETRQIEEWFPIDCSKHSIPQMEIGPVWVFDYDHLFKSFNICPGLSSEEAEILYQSYNGDQGVGYMPRSEVPLSVTPVTPASPDRNAASCSGTHDTHDTESDANEAIFQDSFNDPENIVDDPSTTTNDVGEIPTNLDDAIPVPEVPSIQVDVLPIPEVASIKVHKDHPVENIIDNLNDGVKTRYLSQNTCLYTNIHDTGILENCLYSCFISQVEPKNVEMALQYNSWIKVMQEELVQFDKQKVWNLVNLPAGVYSIGTKWVFKCKKDGRGVVRNKARLVDQGFNQSKGIDYTEVYAPVARIAAIRLFLAFASFKGFKVYQLDVKVFFSMEK